MIIVLFGQPHSGKTTISDEMYQYYLDTDETFQVDGDNLRDVFKNKDYSREGRLRNLQKASDIAAYLSSECKNVILSLVYPYKEARDYLNNLVPNVKWVYLTYTNLRGREANHVKDFEEPELENFLQINTDNLTIKESILNILEYVAK